MVPALLKLTWVWRPYTRNTLSRDEVTDIQESVASVHNSSFKDSVDYTAIKSLCWCYAFSLLKPD